MQRNRKAELYHSFKIHLKEKAGKEGSFDFLYRRRKISNCGN